MTAVAVPAAPGWQSLSAVDRCWRGIEFTRVITAIDLPRIEDVRRAMWQLACATPEVRRWYRPGTAQWRPVLDGERDEWLAATVVKADAADGVPAAMAAQPRLAGIPLRISVGPDWVGARQDHGLGDGWSNLQLLSHLLRQARRLAPIALPWARTSPRRRDLGLVRGVVRHPHTAVRAVRARHELRGGRYEPASRHADGLGPSTVHRVSAAGFTEHVRALRDAHVPGASVAALTLVGLRQALRATLPPARPGFECVFDTRYTMARAFGNWSAGVYLVPIDDLSPVAVTDAIVRARRTGLPILASASMRARRPDMARQVVAPEGAPRLTLSFSHLRRGDVQLPGLDEQRGQLAIDTVPNGVESISASIFDFGGRLHLNVSFYAQVWPLEAVERAVTDFVADPARCLQTPPARTGAPA